MKGELYMIGNILKYIRICNDYSTKEVAIMMETTVSRISDIENNRKNVTLTTLNKFSNCYNIEISKILYLDELEQKGKTRKEILKEILEYYIEKEKIENKSL